MRNPESHKGENGRVLVIAGSDQYPGAVCLTAEAALRTGVDLVHVVTSQRAGLVLNQRCPECIVHTYEEAYFSDSAPFLHLLENADAVVIGPGLGKETREAVRSFLLENTLPAVIDADALAAIDMPLAHGSVLTPHKKEFENMFAVEATKEHVKSHASKDTIILLKGPVDVISDGTRIVENTAGNASMTKGGTGDVLAGIVGGLLAQQRSLFSAAVEAAKINGQIGDELFKEKGNYWITSEMLEKISEHFFKSQNI